MTDPILLRRADEVFDSVMMLDEAATNGRAFRFLLGNLVGRARTAEEAHHEVGIRMVHAGLLRAQVTCVVSMLDGSSRGGERASIGHVAKLLEDDHLTQLLTIPDVFDERRRDAGKLREMGRLYSELLKSDKFKRIKLLRNQAIAHLLRIEAPDPAVQNHEVSDLHDDAERLILLLFDGLGYGEPKFVSQEQTIRENATLFWDTYHSGMRQGQ